MKKLIALALLLSLTGCLFNSKSSSKDISLVVVFSPPYYFNSVPYHIVKLTPELKSVCRKRNQRYMDWGNYPCHFGKRPPEKITLLTTSLIPYNQMPSGKEEEYINNQLDTLPPSAWRTYTIYPQQVIEQAKREKPVTELHTKGTRVTLILNIDGQGNVYQEIEHERIIDDRFGT